MHAIECVYLSEEVIRGKTMHECCLVLLWPREEVRQSSPIYLNPSHTCGQVHVFMHDGVYLHIEDQAAREVFPVPGEILTPHSECQILSIEDS